MCERVGVGVATLTPTSGARSVEVLSDRRYVGGARQTVGVVMVALDVAGEALLLLVLVGLVVLLTSLEQTVAAEVVVLAHVVGVEALPALRLLVEGGFVERAVALVVTGTGVACHAVLLSECS